MFPCGLSMFDERLVVHSVPEVSEVGRNISKERYKCKKRGRSAVPGVDSREYERMVRREGRLRWRADSSAT